MSSSWLGMKSLTCVRCYESKIKKVRGRVSRATQLRLLLLCLYRRVLRIAAYVRTNVIHRPTRQSHLIRSMRRLGVKRVKNE